MAVVAFSSDGVEVISRRLDSLTCRSTAAGSGLLEYYEIERCKDFILANNFKKVWWHNYIAKESSVLLVEFN